MDYREVNHKWYTSFDEKEMVFIIERGDDEPDYRIPAKFEICDTCDGKGKIVNPAIDSHGLSSEDFDRDPDFEEDYFSGMYDINCNECGGRRVSLEVDWEKLSESSTPTKKYVEDYIAEHYQYDYECRREREMGY